MGELERPEGTPDVVDRGRRLFQFLAAAQRLRMSPVRTTDAYERDGAVYWLGEIPDHADVDRTAEEPSPEDPLLVVPRVASAEPPEPGEEFRRWLDGPFSDPDRTPGLTDLVLDLDGTAGPADAVTAAHRDWLARWNDWAEAERADRPVRALYKSLFSTYTTATNEAEEFELVLGVGCLAWAPDGDEPVSRHVLTTGAVIEFDDATGSLAVRARAGADALVVELDMLDPARHPSPTHLTDVVTRAREHAEHPLHRTAAGELARRLAFSLDPDAKYEPQDARPTAGAAPIVAFAPALILRRRSQLGLVAVFDRIADAIAADGRVPAGLLPLLDPDRQPATTEEGPAGGAMVAVGDEVFLPLPLNDRQLDIIRRVDRQAQTLVQGPPGTGKTHLAAALISHLLAQGKRVLVTAHTDRALKEVRGKLPEAIKPLAVAVVGTDLTDMADLKVAVQRISTRSADVDPQTAVAEADDAAAGCLLRIEELGRRRAVLRARLVQARAADVARHSHAGYSGTLALIARAYRTEAAVHEWMLALDRPAPDSPPPLTSDEASTWLVLLRNAEVAADEAEARGRLVDRIPTPDQFSQLVERAAAGTTAYDAVGEWARHPAFERMCAIDAAERTAVQERMNDVVRHIRDVEQRHEQWLGPALRDVRSGRVATWQARAERLDGLLAAAGKGLRHLQPTDRITITGDADRGALASLAQYLHEHVNTNGPVKVNPDGTVRLGAFSSKAVKTSRVLFEQVRVNDRPPTTAADLSVLRAFLEVEGHVQALDEAWPSDVQVPRQGSLAERFEWHATEAQQLGRLLALGLELDTQWQRFDELALPRPDWNDVESVLAYVRLVDAAAARDASVAGGAPLEELTTFTAGVCTWDDAAQASRRLHEAVRSRRPDAYAVAYSRMEWLHDVRRLAADRDALTARLQAGAPSLAAAVLGDPGDPRWTQRLWGLPESWNWARTGAWILAQETEDANELHQQMDVLEHSLRGEVERLAGLRAWRHALAPGRLTGQARADLNLYAQLVRRLGKGTGKYGAVRRAEVRQAMERCRPAVPVWIMPIYRIAEQLQVTEDMFDVVIVDEASQAGLEATFLQYLAPKIVVIGDDRQVSPSAVGVDQQQLRDLAAHHLWDDRYQASWQDPRRSLFDEASMRFGAKRTLVEHRRCVPEIIGFSNRIAYEPDNIRLVPVRQFGADRLEPVRVVHVADGAETGGRGSKVNLPEVAAIVAQVVLCLADPRYDGKTFGVISLAGARQARAVKEALLERITPEDWTARDLRCGDAADFQGSERDVMFLSMVSSAVESTHARTQEGDVQRYNVAASRAKEQMWVFHSLELGRLTNTEDMRFQLLDYCYGVAASPPPAGAGLVSDDVRVAPFESLFEQRIHNRIVERGYTVLPQYDAMGYRIDLVVVGAKGRLAVECDGDAWEGPSAYEADLGLQRDLQRCGWQFFRIRESSYYVDPDAVLSRLWDTLAELEIRPGGVEEEVPAAVAVAVDSRGDADDGDQAVPAVAVATVVPAAAVEPVVPVVPAAFSAPARVIDLAARAIPAMRRPEVPPLKPYQAYQGSAPTAAGASDSQLLMVLRDIVAVEGPVMGSRVHDAFAVASGGHGVGRQTAGALNRALNVAITDGTLIANDPLARGGLRTQTFRLPDQPEVDLRMLGPRDLGQVPPRELAQLLRDAAEADGWDSAENVQRAALNRLGRFRFTTAVQETFAAILPLVHEVEEGLLPVLPRVDQTVGQS